MKRIVAIAAALLLVLGLAACGAGEAGQPLSQPAPTGEASRSEAPAGGVAPASQPDKAESEAQGETEQAAPASGAMDSLIDWMRGGTFSYDFTMHSEYEGQVTEASGWVAMDGGNMAITTEQTVEGMTVISRVIILEGETYVIDESSRLIIKMPGAGPEMTAGLASDYEDMVAVGSGTGEVNGRTLPYEEYTVEGIGTKYYMDGGMVYAIESTYEGAYTLMVISNASSTVPAGAFDLPEGYMEMSV